MKSGLALAQVGPFADPTSGARQSSSTSRAPRRPSPSTDLADAIIAASDLRRAA